MRYQNVFLKGLAHELPPRVITSAAIEDRLAPVYEKLKLPAGRLEMMSGVRERRGWEEGTRPRSVSARVARAALRRSGVDPARVGALVHASVTRDYLEPATASFVAGAVGIAREAMVLDVSNACLGFMNAMALVGNMLELGQIEAGVIVATEDGGPLLETAVRELLTRTESGQLDRRSIKPWFASLTIGSGSVAAVLTGPALGREAGRPAAPRLLGGAFRQATEHAGLCRSAPDRGFAAGDATPVMETDSEQMLVHGCLLAGETWRDFLRELEWTPDAPQAFFSHQVGSAHRRAMFETLGIELERDHPTLPTLGNVGSVSCPISLSLAAEAGTTLRPGTRAALLGIGSGLNCGMLGVEWA